MTEIKIEKKTPVWPWILVVLIIVAILIYAFAFNDDETDVRQEDHTEQRMEEESANEKRAAMHDSDVSTYVSFIKKDSNPMKIDHEFTNEALSKLTEATRAMAAEIDYDIHRDLEELKRYTAKINTDPFETTHANSIRKSAEILATILQNIQRKAYSNLTGETDGVKNAAMSIKPDVQTLDQKENIKNFFRKSANLLEKMNTNSPKL